jgi:hypothetical protein
MLTMLVHGLTLLVHGESIRVRSDLHLMLSHLLLLPALITEVAALAHGRMIHREGATA